MLRCHRSGRLYRNIQGLGFFQIPHPCLGIALQTLCAKQLPSPTWKHSTTWQRVFRSRASFPGGKSHWQKIFTRANRTQSVSAVNPASAVESHWETQGMQPSAPTRCPGQDGPQGLSEIKGQDLSHHPLAREAQQNQLQPGCSPGRSQGERTIFAKEEKVKNLPSHYFKHTMKHL